MEKLFQYMENKERDQLAVATGLFLHLGLTREKQRNILSVSSVPLQVVQ